MRRIIPYIAFLCLTGFTATSGLPVMANGCNGNMNKTAENKCAENDTECQTEKAEKFEINKTVRSWKLSQLSLIINSSPRDLLEFIFCLTIGYTAELLGII